VSWLHHPFTPPLDPSRRINVQVFPLRRSVTDPAMNAGIMVIGQPQIVALDRAEQVCWPRRKWYRNFPNFLPFPNTSLLDPQYLPICVRFTLWPYGNGTYLGVHPNLGACWLTTFPWYQLARKCPRRSGHAQQHDANKSWQQPGGMISAWIQRWWDLLKFMGYDENSWDIKSAWRYPFANLMVNQVPWPLSVSPRPAGRTWQHRGTSGSPANRLRSRIETTWQGEHQPSFIVFSSNWCGDMYVDNYICIKWHKARISDWCW